MKNLLIVVLSIVIGFMAAVLWFRDTNTKPYNDAGSTAESPDSQESPPDPHNVDEAVAQDHHSTKNEALRTKLYEAKSLIPRWLVFPGRAWNSRYQRGEIEQYLGKPNEEFFLGMIALWDKAIDGYAALLTDYPKDPEAEGALRFTRTLKEYYTALKDKTLPDQESLLDWLQDMNDFIEEDKTNPELHKWRGIMRLIYFSTWESNYEYERVIKDFDFCVQQYNINTFESDVAHYYRAIAKATSMEPPFGHGSYTRDLWATERDADQRLKDIKTFNSALDDLDVYLGSHVPLSHVGEQNYKLVVALRRECSETHDAVLNTSPGDFETKSAKDIYDISKDSVVKITHKYGSATGFVCLRRKDMNTIIILTNRHVVEDMENGNWAVKNVKVEFTNGKILDATSVNTHATLDLAALKIKYEDGSFLADLRLFRHVGYRSSYYKEDLIFSGTEGEYEIRDEEIAQFAQAKDIKVGQPVLIIGHPGSSGGTLDWTLTQGGVSKLLSSNTVQFDAVTNPGNSGGPILNRGGQVVGIVMGGIYNSSHTNALEGLTIAAFGDALEQFASASVWRK